jgi:hypothetical protein
LVPLTELKHARIPSSYYLVGGREQLCWLLRVVLLRFTSRAHSLRTGEDADNAYLSIDGFAAEFDVRPSILRRLARSGLVTVIRAEDAKRSPVRMSLADVKPLLKQLRVEALACQEGMNLIRAARNEAAFMSIRNGFIFVVLAISVVLLGATLSRPRQNPLNAKFGLLRSSSSSIQKANTASVHGCALGVFALQFIVTTGKLRTRRKKCSRG